MESLEAIPETQQCHTVLRQEGAGGGDVEGGQVTSLDAGVSVWKRDGEMSSPGQTSPLQSPRVRTQNAFSNAAKYTGGIIVRRPRPATCVDSEDVPVCFGQQVAQTKAT